MQNTASYIKRSEWVERACMRMDTNGVRSKMVKLNLSQIYWYRYAHCTGTDWLWIIKLGLRNGLRPMKLRCQNFLYIHTYGGRDQKSQGDGTGSIDLKYMICSAMPWPPQPWNPEGILFTKILKIHPWVTLAFENNVAQDRYDCQCYKGSCFLDLNWNNGILK